MNFKNMKIKVDNNLDEIVEKLNYLGFKKAGWIGYKNPKFITANSKGFYTDHGADLWLMFGDEITLAEIEKIKILVEIKLLNFIQESGLADFEVTHGKDDYFTCHASVCLDDFVIGEQVIKPHAWFNLDESHVDKSDWFKRNELFLLNNVFEENFRKFL